ncbi:restriction endonuclease subunit S [Micromonospora sp. NPDC020750]|uniref:restriction endonuclease subunit S n=1 Tax=unclassified Micromonospora TaxID=2617518 RepID=UPI00378D98FE
MTAVSDKTSGNPKTLQSEYLRTGFYPVVDQGKNLIAGFTNDPTLLHRTSGPVIVFGDHTRCFKYVDFPFSMGADGVKVLKPQAGWDPKFLYYYLTSLPLPNAGYSRHFKFLKEQAIIQPPLRDQRRIAEVLDWADDLRAKRREAVAHLDDLTQSIFLDLLSCYDPTKSEWESSLQLGEVADISSGITKGRKTSEKSLRTVPYLAVANVQDKRIELSSVKQIEATEQEIERYQLRKDDLLLTEGGDPDKLGRGSLWNDELPEAIHQNHIFRARITDPRRVNPVYLNYFISSDRGKRYFLRSAKQTTGIASINMVQLRRFPLLLPPIEAQQEFARRVRAVQSLGATHRASLSEMGALFVSLQDRAFRGML